MDALRKMTPKSQGLRNADPSRNRTPKSRFKQRLKLRHYLKIKNITDNKSGLESDSENLTLKRDRATMSRLELSLGFQHQL